MLALLLIHSFFLRTVMFFRIWVALPLFSRLKFFQIAQESKETQMSQIESSRLSVSEAKHETVKHVNHIVEFYPRESLNTVRTNNVRSSSTHTLNVFTPSSLM